MYLLAACAAHPDRLFQVKLDVRSMKMANTLADGAMDAGATGVTPWANQLLNYFHSTCERFPIDDCLALASLQQASAARNSRCREVNIVLCTERHSDAVKLRDYLADVLDDVLDDLTQKPHGRTLRLQPSIRTDPLLKPGTPARPVRSQSAELLHLFAFGDWLRHAMCLAPLQISRCAGNTLQSMHDGEPRRFQGQAAATDIIALADRLRLGPYECILNAHNGPVVVVCALGQQSVGKSYQLNHLGGVFLDVAGGRCTDGIWLTARHFTDNTGVTKLVLFLDCEGIGSLERTETEDMLHCLLAAAVSSFTMFKTHFAFSRELVDTLNRMNKGAQKVQCISGDSETAMVFRGRIAFCLKDVQPSAMQATIQEFQGKLRALVQQEHNFVSRMFGNSVTVTACPTLSRAFYKTLEKACVPSIRDPQCPAYQDGPTALRFFKLMLAKIEHKDWTPIDRHWVTAQAAAVRAAMHAACHFGCDGAVEAEALSPEVHPLLPEQKDRTRKTVAFGVLVSSASHAASLHQRLAGKALVRSVRIDEQAVASETEAVSGPGDAAAATSSFLGIELELDDDKLRLGQLEVLRSPGGSVPATHRVSRESVQQDLRGLRRLLTKVLELDRPEKDAEQFRVLHAVLCALVLALIRRREARCTAWLQAAISKFSGSPEASELQNLLSVHLQRLEAAWAMCSATCATCHLPCSALGLHSEHDCSTDHRCCETCEYCVKEGLKDAAVCKDKAGHTGHHMCVTQEHTCGGQCKFSAALDCRGTCRKQPGHEGPCDCESGNHLCGAPCALPGCPGLCKQPYGAEHDHHDCGNEACPERCPLCNRQCPSGHFHLLTEPGSYHLCGREHECIDPDTGQQRHCASVGACAINSEVETVERRTFHGRAAEFDYDHRTNQVVERKVCTKKIPPGKMAHWGPCRCDRKTLEHFCAHKCPGCRYRCSKRMGHSGRHKMQHGNIREHVFLSNRDVFDLGDRKYARGDAGEAETCDSICCRLGRGHVHLQHCHNHALCGDALLDGVRHLKGTSVRAAAEHTGTPSVDEVTHEFYWKHLNIEDPCVETERAQFRKCASVCASEAHQNGDGTCETVHCVLPLWHAPLDPLAFPGDHPLGTTEGHISSDGCLFPCRHLAAAVHTIFIIDRSASMNSRQVRPDNADIREHPDFVDLDNTLGVVYEAALRYMRERSARAPQDLLTFIAFDKSAVLKIAAQPITDIKTHLQKMMHVKCGSGTDFSHAMRRAFTYLAKWRRQQSLQHGHLPTRRRLSEQQTQQIKPVMIMLTDSQDYGSRSGPATLIELMGDEASLPEEERVSVHLIGFGPSVRESYMQELADIGNGSYLVCQTGTDMDRHDLVKAFNRLAAQPALKASLLHDIRQSGAAS